MRNDCASSAEEAVELMRRAAAAGDPYEVVLLDMQMPGADGITLARMIKAEPALAGARLIMLTSLGYLPSERLWRESGINAYLVKPVKQSRLFDVLAQVMRDPRLDAPTAIAIAPPPSVTHAGTFAAQAVRILLAEDNPVNQKVALRQLSKLGYHADAVSNGAEALRALDRFDFPVILMDCQMPELDGYKTTQHIREAEPITRRRPYIIAMTANALTGDREACLAAGMDDYISKPVRIDELDAALQRGIAAALKDKAPATPSQPSGSDDNTPLIDANAVENLRALRMEGEPDPLAELVELFVADTPGRLAEMKSAAQRSDAESLEAAAHSLKGSASNLGAARIAARCARIMQHARNGEFAAASKLVAPLDHDFAQVQRLLLDEMRR